MSHFAITGIPAGNNAPRREVDAWYKEAQEPTKFPVAALQLSLFSRALKRLQDQDPFDPDTGRLSYYRLAGIHGWPQNLPWDGVQPLKDNKGYNFCVHANTTFPTWHRPYLALYEQALYGHMKEIVAKEIPPERQQEWNDAADTWRLPYWDYAQTPAICEIATLQSINILDTTNQDKIVPFDNPMYSYRISTGSTFGEMKPPLGIKNIYNDKAEKDIAIPSSIVRGTSRYAIKMPADPQAPWVQGISDNKAVSKAFSGHEWPPDQPNKASGTIRENVYRLLTMDYFESWRSFGSTKYYKGDKDARQWLSLESVHNMAHVWSGGGDIEKEGTGHMAFIELSAFDPIFWLHHCFIDMILAAWQTRTDNKFWFNDQVESTDPKPTDPLPPFHMTGDQPFTSDDIEDWTNLNYTYDFLVPDELHRNSNGSIDTEEYQKALANKINMRYSTTRSEVLKALSAPSQRTVARPDYIINVTYNKHALMEPYSIHLFAGPIDPSIGSDRAQPNRLGTVYTFSRFNPLETCPNCKEQSERGDLSTGQIPITGAMIRDMQDPTVIDLNTMDSANVENYLERFLSWKIVTVTGREIEPRDLPNLKITVLVGRGEHSDGTHFLSTYTDYEPLFKATTGKPGGATEELGAY